MENKAPKKDKQTKKRSKAAKIVLFSILGCIGVDAIVILVKLIIGMAGGTGTQDGSILGLGFGTLFTVLGFLVLALVLAWLLTEPSFKKEETVVIDNDRNSYVKKAKTPRPLADKTGVKAEEKKPEEKPAEEPKEEKPEEKPAEKPAEESKEKKPEEKSEEKPEKEAAQPVASAVAEKEPENKKPENKESDSDATSAGAQAAPVAAAADSAAAPAAAGAAPVAAAVAGGAAGAVGAFAAVGGAETVFVRYRRSYMSRLIQADDDVKAYYKDIKNKLLSYKDVHDRVSWDFESFNNGRKKLAKINVKGKTILVNLALDPATLDAKYYATDMSDKPKFSEVPTLMKVKSGRSVKYTLELIEKMMADEEIPAAAVPSDETFDLTYRDNDELIKEGYIKAIYDKDVDPDGNYVEKEVDIEDLINN